MRQGLRVRGLFKGPCPLDSARDPAPLPHSPLKGPAPRHQERGSCRSSTKHTVRATAGLRHLSFCLSVLSQACSSAASPLRCCKDKVGADAHRDSKDVDSFCLCLERGAGFTCDVPHNLVFCIYGMNLCRFLCRVTECCEALFQLLLNSAFIWRLLKRTAVQSFLRIILCGCFLY